MCIGCEVGSFGKVKGMIFERTLFLPIKPQWDFLQCDPRALTGGSNDTAVNPFDVASTKAGCSVGF